MLSTLIAGLTLPDHKRTLKLDSFVMLLSNIDAFRGLFYGVCHIVKAVHTNLPTLNSLTMIMQASFLLCQRCLAVPGIATYQFKDIQE